MTEWIVVLAISAVATAAWCGSVLGLPGNWLIVALAAGAWYLAEPGTPLTIGPGVLLTLVLLAATGETLEFLAGALGVKKLGGSRRSTWLAVLGSLAGAVLGFVVGSGIPVVGNVLMSLLGSALGAFGGALYGERTAGSDWEPALQIGGAAFIGRLLGTASKLLCGAMMLIIFLAAIWI
ncbi:MAG: DUF456 domain-containing protein [Pirellulaceae bacterium]|nr:DUF456 domain-containing protein [Pirellulaceae bacterium]